MKKRIRILGAVFAVCFSALAIKAEYIQIEGHEELSAAAQKQQTLKINGIDSRSIIYDRNGARITNTSKGYVYIIKRNMLNINAKNLLNAADASEGDKTSDMYAIYYTENMNEDIRKELEENYDAYVIETGSRYSENQPAAHIIGYLNGQTGVSGLEAKYQNQLYSLSNSTFVYTDAEGTILRGEEPQVSYAEDAFLTTIDIQLQKSTEKILENCGYDSAAVVTESKTGNILAIASTPAYSPRHIEKYMNSKSGCLLNKALQSYPPGSVFKIIVAAAALENGIDTADMKFVCTGEETFGDIRIKCTAVHGEVDIYDAFAESCNCAFIQLGEKTGYEAIYEMADKMGIGTKTLGLTEETAGNITEEQEAAGAGLANMSIGQGQLLATPVQIARITNIIASDGIDRGLHIVDEDMTCKQIISSDTAEEIKKMMRDVVLHGTAAGSSTSECAGKTGSAESGSCIHGWFTGFFPCNNPQYTITVFCENGKSGRESALKVFDQIAHTLR